MRLEYQCKKCGKPMDRSGVCATCRLVRDESDWKELDRMDEERREKDEH